MWYVYLLLCDRHSFYVGISPDVKKRIGEHRAKESFFTKKFADIQLVHCEIYNNKFEAAKREKQIKGWRREKKQKLVDGELGINVCTEIIEAI